MSIDDRSRGISHKLLILRPIIIGILVLMRMAKGREPLRQVEPGEPTRTVRVIEAPLLDRVPTAEGYGPVQPAKVWAEREERALGAPWQGRVIQRVEIPPG